MSYALTYQPEAAADVQQGATWYEQQRPGLGHRFINELQAAEERIIAGPESYRCIHQELRRAPLHHFPHGIFYLIEDISLLISVLAVFHARRDPADWQGRHSDWFDG